jgi:hypothetical protein
MINFLRENKATLNNMLVYPNPTHECWAWEGRGGRFFFSFFSVKYVKIWNKIPYYYGTLKYQEIKREIE